MIDPIKMDRERDLGAERLPDLWLRRGPPVGGGPEAPGRGLWRTGPNGEFRKAVIEAIDQARQVVLVASFLLADAPLVEAMLRAGARGVRVYVITASEQRVSRAPDDDELFEKRMVDDHKKLLRDLAGKTLLRSAEHFHAKFVVVDPPWVKGGTTRALLSTANFNKALIDGVEIGVELDAARAAAVATVFAHAFWNEAERELVEVDRLATIAKPPAVPAISPHPDVFVTTRSSTTLREAVLDLIGRARRELVISSYGLDPSHASVAAIRDAAKRGVAVTLLTRPRPAVQAAARALADAGVTVRAHEKLHAKAIVADGAGLVMTANLEAHGLDRGFELGVRLQDSAVLVRVLKEWTDAFPWEFRASPTRTQSVGEVWLASKGSREPKVRVVERQTITLPPVVAADALELDKAPLPELALPANAEQVPCKVRYEWEVQAPKLPREAKERLRTVKRSTTDKDGKAITVDERVAYEPPVYEQRGAVFVKLRSPAEADAARRLAAELKARVVL